MITNPKIDFIETDEVLLNGTVVAKGAMSATIHNEIRMDDFGLPDQKISIEGTLETGYYIQDLTSIETNRYYIEDVVVTNEHYGSLENKVIYEFQASLFQVKFQDKADQYYIVEKDIKE